MIGDYDVFVCEARVRFRGKDLALDKTIANINLADIMPITRPIDPFDFHRIQQTDERRRRLVDYIAAQFAHALTEALFADARK